MTPAGISSHPLKGAVATPVPLVRGMEITEAPVYDAAGDRILFSDVLGGGVWAYAWDGSLTQVVPRRRGIGGMALTKSGGLVVSGKDLAVADLTTGTLETVCIASHVDGSWIGFNDLCVDQQGRIYVGALGFAPVLQDTGPPGGVTLIESSARATSAFSPIGLPNGMAFDSVRSRLYVCDSASSTILVLGHDPHTGSLTEQSRICLATSGRPDGVAIAADGSLYVATAEGGTIEVLDPDGRPLWSIPIPIPLVTNVCFGGPEKDILFVTGGQLDGTSGVEAAPCLWALRSGSGMPVASAEVDPIRATATGREEER